MTEQFARSARFSGHDTVLVTECPDGTFGVHAWGGSGAFLGIAATPEELTALIRDRPAYSYAPSPKAPTIIAGINIDELEIDL